MVDALNKLNFIAITFPGIVILFLDCSGGSAGNARLAAFNRPF